MKMIMETNVKILKFIGFMVLFVFVSMLIILVSNG